MTKISIFDDDNEVYNYNSNDEIVEDVKKEKKRTEIINEFSSGKIAIQESTELGETYKHLNDTSLTDDQKFSGIDLRSRLHPTEISGLLAIDTLVSFGYIPISSSVITVCKKRLSVSKNGEGRKEIVDIAVGKREQDVRRAGGQGFGEKLAGIFKPKE